MARRVTAIGINGSEVGAFEVNEAAYIREVRKKIALKLQLHPACIKLLHGTDILLDSQGLLAQHVPDTSNVLLTVVRDVQTILQGFKDGNTITKCECCSQLAGPGIQSDAELAAEVVSVVVAEARVTQSKTVARSIMDLLRKVAYVGDEEVLSAALHCFEQPIVAPTDSFLTHAALDVLCSLTPRGYQPALQAGMRWGFGHPLAEGRPTCQASAVRLVAAAAEIGDEEAISASIEYLENGSSEDVQVAACAVLCAIAGGHGRAKDAIKACAKSGRSARARTAALEAWKALSPSDFPADPEPRLHPGNSQAET